MIPYRKFQARRHQNIWEDSDEEDNNPSDTEVIYLGHVLGPSASTNINTTAVQTQPDEQPSLPPPSSSIQEQQQIMAPYIPRTLHHDSRRYSILPAFPTSFYNDRPPLLLANTYRVSRKSPEVVNREHQFLFAIFSA